MFAILRVRNPKDFLTVKFAISFIGAIHCRWYETPEKVEPLLALDNLGSLGTTLADTVAYHRDRGEDMQTARRYRDIDAYRRDGKSDCGADYLYLYNGGAWFIYGVADEDWIELQVTVNQEGK